MALSPRRLMPPGRACATSGSGSSPKSRSSSLSRSAPSWPRRRRGGPARRTHRRLSRAPEPGRSGTRRGVSGTRARPASAPIPQPVSSPRRAACLTVRVHPRRRLHAPHRQSLAALPSHQRLHRPRSTSVAAAARSSKSSPRSPGPSPRAHRLLRRRHAQDLGWAFCPTIELSGWRQTARRWPRWRTG
jgi:hypothetical protein